MFELIVPRSATTQVGGAGALIDSDETLGRALAAARRTLHSLPWPFGSEHLAVRIVQTLSRLTSGCARPYVLRQLQQVVPTADAREAVLAAMTAAGGPFAVVEGDAFDRGDVIACRDGGAVQVATFDDDAGVNESIYGLLEGLPRRMTASDLRAAISEGIEPWTGDGADRVAAAEAAVRLLFGAGLLRAAGADGVRLLTQDPRDRVYFERGGDALDSSGTAWVDEALAVIDALGDRVFAPTLELVAPLPRTERAVAVLIEEIVRLRNHVFDEAACLLQHDPAVPAPPPGVLDRLARANVRLRCELRVLTVVGHEPQTARLAAVSQADWIARRLGAASLVVWDAPVVPDELDAVAGAVTAAADGRSGVTLGPRAGQLGASCVVDMAHHHAMGSLVRAEIGAMRCREGRTWNAVAGRLQACCALSSHVAGPPCRARGLLGDAPPNPDVFAIPRPLLVAEMPALVRPGSCL